MSNALLCFDVRRSEDELATLSGFTAADGTSAKGILRALGAVAKSEPAAGIRPFVLNETREDVAMLKLADLLRCGRPAILCVDEFDHWVVALGLLGSLVHVCDPADTELIITYRPQALAERWRGKGRKPFYAILL